MDSCKRDDTYDGLIADSVYKWLTDEDDKNLLCWLRLSVDLCCTNVLQSVRSSLVEQKRSNNKLNEIVSVEFNRIKIIEQLANMKPLLFNLPMIVSKIVNDLNRFPQYQDEALVWKSVQQKLSFLPRFIDERCMPLVQLINDGSVSNSLKFNKSFLEEVEDDAKLENFVTHFPKTVFKEPFVDFQMIVISNLRQLSGDDSKNIYSSVFTREEITGAAICYETRIVILQKENDKYLLKPFRSLNQKLLPFIPFHQIHVTKQTVKEINGFAFELTILLINKALLIQILFKFEETRDGWFDHIVKMSKKLYKPNPSPSKVILCGSSMDIGPAGDLLKSLDDISNGFSRTIDFLSDNSTNETESNVTGVFFLKYMKLLHNFTIVGKQIITKLEKTETNPKDQSQVVSKHICKISNISSKMNQLLTEWNRNSPLKENESSERKDKKDNSLPDQDDMNL